MHENIKNSQIFEQIKKIIKQQYKHIWTYKIINNFHHFSLFPLIMRNEEFPQLQFLLPYLFKLNSQAAHRCLQ